MASSHEKAPSYKGRRPASERASAAARGASKKTGTRCELLLRRRLWRAGCRYRTDARDLPGRPDVVFNKARLVVFVDGDFWHGNGWEERRVKLERGSNPCYWVPKIKRNFERDHHQTRQLEEEGWTVLRVWESEIHEDLAAVTTEILAILDARGHRRALTKGVI